MTDNLRAIILAAQGVEDSEFSYPYYRLNEEGYTVDVALKGKAPANGKYGLPIKPFCGSEKDNLVGFEFDRDYNLLVIPGGFEAPARLRVEQSVLSFINDMDNSGKLISAICHGPQVLISAGIVKGRQITGYKDFRVDLENAGAEYLDQPVVCYGNLVTAQHYKDLPEFMKAVIERSNDLR
jgi:protease I